MSAPVVAIVDYGVGNLYSVARASEAAGLETVATSDPDVIRGAAGVILPGIGAFGDAMAAMQRLGLVECLRRLPEQGTPLVGVCLGLQLLMERSLEFGNHEGLGLIAGSVERLQPGGRLKVPHVGWTAIAAVKSSTKLDPWAASLLADTPPDEPMYFVHSYVVKPLDTAVVLADARYGEELFVAAVSRGAVSGFQFHPERSGPAGLAIYRRFAATLSRREESCDH